METKRYSRCFPMLLIVTMYDLRRVIMHSCDAKPVLYQSGKTWLMLSLLWTIIIKDGSSKDAVVGPTENQPIQYPIKQLSCLTLNVVPSKRILQ